MRTVSITRRKTFVGCAGRLKVYVDDPVGDLVINGTACRLLGMIKNGDTETFYIDEEAHRLFFIFDKISRNYCNEFTDIAAGEECIFLSGKNHYNPVAGNPFRLDGLVSAEVLENRRRGSRKGVLVFVAAIIIGFIIGFAGVIVPLLLDGVSSEPKTFTSAGMSITLTEAFDVEADANFDVCYVSNGEAVMVNRERLSAEDMADITLYQYCAAVIEVFEEEASPRSEDGLTYFEYEINSDGTNYRYLVVVYKSTDAFWTVQFGTTKGDFEEMRPTMMEWAKSVTFE